MLFLWFIRSQIFQTLKLDSKCPENEFRLFNFPPRENTHVACEYTIMNGKSTATSRSGWGRLGCSALGFSQLSRRERNPVLTPYTPCTGAGSRSEWGLWGPAGQQDSNSVPSLLILSCRRRQEQSGRQAGPQADKDTPRLSLRPQLPSPAPASVSPQAPPPSPRLAHPLIHTNPDSHFLRAPPPSCRPRDLTPFPSELHKEPGTRAFCAIPSSSPASCPLPSPEKSALLPRTRPPP